MSVITYY